MTAVILFVLGAVVGSFLNVVGLRWGLPRLGGVLSNFGGRSSCPSCGKILKWRELVPILSFFILKARCRGCQKKISWQYPTVEILTGLVFATIYNLQFTILQNLIFLVVFSIYIVITIYDFKHKIIPDSLVYTAILLSVVSRWLLVSSILDWLAGPILFAFLGSIWLLSKGRAIGFGDAKLGLSVGLLLGAVQGFSAMVLAFWIGAAISLAYLFFDKISFLKSPKKLTMKSEVPFAPFIILGAWISLMFSMNILHVVFF